MNISWFHILFLTVITTLAAARAPAAETPSRMSREEAFAAKQKAEAAITASQNAISAATQANKPKVVEKAKILLKHNQQKLAEAEALLRAVLAAEDPLRDPVFVAAALEKAKKEASDAYFESDMADVEVIFSLPGDDRKRAARAADEAWARFLSASQVVRDLRTKKQELEHPQLMADLKRLRQDPTLAAELAQVQERIRKDELARLKQFDEAGDARKMMQREIGRLIESGVCRNTVDVLTYAKTNPRGWAVFDRAREQAMHDKADILRDSTDKLWQEVQRLKQKRAQPIR